MIPITMAVCNRPRITELAIRELEKRTVGPYDLTVYNDASGDKTANVLNALCIDDLIHQCIWGKETSGIHYARNRLLYSFMGNPLFVSTDNDIIPQSPINRIDWLQLLTDLMERHPDYAAIALRPHVMIGDDVNKMFEDADEVVERAHVGGVLRMMRTQAVLDVGGWSEKIQPGRDNEEQWICGKLRKAGWKVGYSRDIRAIHEWGRPELDEDDWGYAIGSEHGHNPVWPPPHRYNWDRLGIDWEMCK